MFLSKIEKQSNENRSSETMYSCTGEEQTYVNKREAIKEESTPSMKGISKASSATIPSQILQEKIKVNYKKEENHLSLSKRRSQSLTFSPLPTPPPHLQEYIDFKLILQDQVECHLPIVTPLPRPEMITFEDLNYDKSDNNVPSSPDFVLNENDASIESSSSSLSVSEGNHKCLDLLESDIVSLPRSKITVLNNVH